MKKISTEIEELQRKIANTKPETNAEKLAYLQTKGNIITFLEPQDTNFGRKGYSQIVVTKPAIIKSKSTGNVSLRGEFNRASDWYKDMNALVKAVDWEFIYDAIDFN